MTCAHENESYNFRTITSVPPIGSDDSQNPFSEDDNVETQMSHDDQFERELSQASASGIQNDPLSDRPFSAFSGRDDDNSSTLCSPPPNPRKKRNSSENSNDILREFLHRKRPDPIDFLPPKPQEKDAIQQFFDSIATTVRNFPPLSIAKIKLKIANIVGEEEIACAERNEAMVGSVQFINLDNLTYVEEPTATTALFNTASPLDQPNTTTSFERLDTNPSNGAMDELHSDQS